jgi:phytoene dehydrogenase-like protein
MAKKINIIGAGIAGLTAGCYLQMNGYDTEIFELNSVPGGLCCAWDRKGYTIEGCIHWLVGSAPCSFYNLWNELINMKRLKMFDFDLFVKIEDTDGNYINLYTDVDKLKQELLKKAPEDEKLIKPLIKGIRKMLKFSMPVEKAPETYGFIDGMKMMSKTLPYLGTLRKWLKITAREYGNRCKNPLLKTAIAKSFLPNMSVIFILMTLVWMHNRIAGYPIGGSKNFAGQIEKQYKDLGGKINYRSRVNKILVKNDKAYGIELKNGKKYESDLVISAADGYCTIFEMLKGKYINDKIKDYYENYELFPSYLQVSLGVSKKLDDLPHAVLLELEKPLKLDDETSHNDIGFRIFNFDPTLSPKGKTLVEAILTTYNYKHWTELREKNRKKYKSEKERIGKEVIDIFSKRYGIQKSDIELLDVSSPATVIRFTNNWKGSLEGWLLTPKMGLKQMKKTLPGLDNFYLIGQWVEPGGGLPSALLSGRNVAQIICKGDKKRFST